MAKVNTAGVADFLHIKQRICRHNFKMFHCIFIGKRQRLIKRVCKNNCTELLQGLDYEFAVPLRQNIYLLRQNTFHFFSQLFYTKHIVTMTGKQVTGPLVGVNIIPLALSLNNR